MQPTCHSYFDNILSRHRVTLVHWTVQLISLCAEIFDTTSSTGQLFIVADQTFPAGTLNLPRRVASLLSLWTFKNVLKLFCFHAPLLLCVLPYFHCEVFTIFLIFIVIVAVWR